jgi:hypothetical protein
VHQVGFIYEICEDCCFGSRYGKQIFPRLQSIQSASVVHPTSYSALICSFVRFRVGWRETDHSPPSRAEVMNAWKYSSTVILADLYGVVLK